MIKLGNILDHKVMIDRLNAITTDGVQKNQTRDDVLVEVLKVVIALENGQEALEDDMQSEKDAHIAHMWPHGAPRIFD